MKSNNKINTVPLYNFTASLVTKQASTYNIYTTHSVHRIHTSVLCYYESYKIKYNMDKSVILLI